MSLRFTISTFLVGCLTFTFATSLALAAEDKRVIAPPVSIRILPENVTLWGAQASQHFTVLGQYADGLERDVTDIARFSVSDPKKGEIDSSGKFKARDSVEVTVTANVGDRSAKTTIRIRRIREASTVYFSAGNRGHSDQARLQRLDVSWRREGTGRIQAFHIRHLSTGGLQVDRGRRDISSTHHGRKSKVFPG